MNKINKASEQNKNEKFHLDSNERISTKFLK